MAATPDEQKEILKIAIEEQRRVCDWITHNYDNVRNKILALLGGGLAALTFLYASDGGLFIPEEVYGKIFYFSGLFLTLMALSTLIAALRPMPWEFTIEDKELNKIDTVSSELEYLQYTKEKHMEAYKLNIHTYEYKQRLFNFSLYPLVFGAMILTVIKLFS
jgi:hypothetical protein